MGDLAVLLNKLITEKGGEGSGNWGHGGLPGQWGGSTSGGEAFMGHPKEVRGSFNPKTGAFDPDKHLQHVHDMEEEEYDEYMDQLEEYIDLEKELDLDPRFVELVPEGFNVEALPGLQQAHEEVLKHGLKTGNEMMAVISSRDGSKIFENVPGEKKSVHISDAHRMTIDKADYESLVLVHNHPTSSSFSHTDLYALTTYYSLEAMTVQGHDGSLYCVSAKDAERASPEHIDRVAKFHGEKIFDRYKERLAAGEDEDRVNREFHHELMGRMCDTLGWQYKYIPPEVAKKEGGVALYLRDEIPIDFTVSWAENMERIEEWQSEARRRWLGEEDPEEEEK